MNKKNRQKNQNMQQNQKEKREEGCGGRTSRDYTFVTPPPKDTKQSSKPKVKKVTLKTKVTPVPDNETRTLERVQ